MTLSVEAIAIILGLVCGVGPGFYFLGRLSTRVDHIEQRHTELGRKIGEIWAYVRETKHP